MPPGRRSPGYAHVRVVDLILLTLLVPLTAAALQKHPQRPLTPSSSTDELENEEQWRASTADPLAAQRGHHGTHMNLNSRYKKARASHVNQRALATVSPAENNAAVGAPPAQWVTASSSAGLTSRQPARSLQDWEVEDILLLATVDGKLHARERRSGAPRWTLEVDREMVETIRHPHNKTYDEEGVEVTDPIFIIEPSQDGMLYVLSPELGLQKLPHTVRQLAELSPYAGEGKPALTYTAEKKNTLYTVDAATGNILKTFSSGGSFFNEERNCRRVSPLDSPRDALEESECEPIGTLTLGRTEYTIGVQNRDTGEPFTTIRYFEWGPNNRDSDLRNTYTRTMDQRYVYTRWNGGVYGLDTNKQFSLTRPDFQYMFTSPVCRVFDVVRPIADPSSDASLVILPQPIPPSNNGFDGLGEVDPVYVNHTSAGNWYALSEKNYPSVTDTAPGIIFADFRKNWLKMDIAGVYNLPLDEELEAGMARSLPHLSIDPPPAKKASESVLETLRPRIADQSTSNLLQLIMGMLVTIALTFGGSAAYFKGPQALTAIFKQPHHSASIPSVDTAKFTVEETVSSPTFVREDEPAKETIFPHDDASPPPRVQFIEAPKGDDNTVKASTEDICDDEEHKDVLEVKGGAEVKPKKKATRGRRGGRKQKEKEQLQAEARASKNLNMIPQPEKVISVAASESTQVTGPVQINSLVVHTDKVIGQGSCGTIVFEGTFEGIHVAVKRMLSQYYELASQEVSFLQQSDDHSNVVRYYCQQKDDHFLYIAVELCQASLFEVWEPDKARSDERRVQLQTLKLAIQQDMTATLKQLAEGLHHLHNLRIIHRDIKPQNILVAFPKRSQPAGVTRLVISDFGLGKNLPENVSTLVDPTGNAGTSGWKAPELISQPRETESNHSRGTSNGSDSGSGGVSGVKRAADIFSLGCLFFWVLTDGVHPFEDENGWQQLRELNIKRDKKNMAALEQWSDAYEPMQLIDSMLAHEPQHRPTARAVLNHPYFWEAKKRLDFLCDCSDHFEREARGTLEDNYAGDSQHLRLLEERSEDVIGPGPRADFLSKLDRSFVETLGKQRKYSGNRVLDLLRALRNKKNHYEDMPEEVKRRVGPLVGGYLNYWCNRFPKLLMACHEVVQEAQLQGTDRFQDYFG